MNIAVGVAIVELTVDEKQHIELWRQSIRELEAKLNLCIHKITKPQTLTNK